MYSLQRLYMAASVSYCMQHSYLYVIVVIVVYPVSSSPFSFHMSYFVKRSSAFLKTIYKANLIVHQAFAYLFFFIDTIIAYSSSALSAEILIAHAVSPSTRSSPSMLQWSCVFIAFTYIFFSFFCCVR